MSPSDDRSLTTFVFCWTLERRDGAGLAITSHDRPITTGEGTFEPAATFTPAAVKLGRLSEPLGEVGGALTSDAFSEEDLVSGRWSGAQSTLTSVEWAQQQAVPAMLMGGELGDVLVEGNAFQSDLLSGLANLRGDVCPATSPECRASLGDKRCRVDLAGRSLDRTAVACEVNELDVDKPVDDRFGGGRVLWLSGPNCGFRSVVVGVVDGVLILREPPAGAVTGGERVRLFEGCDKRLSTCRDRYGNAANFRGEPHLPGEDLLTRYPGS